MSSPFVTAPGAPGWAQPPDAGERPYMPTVRPPAPASVVQAMTGEVLVAFRTDPLCEQHFPGLPELTRLAIAAQQGKPSAFVGTGHPLTALACPHTGDGPPWKLGDQMVHISERCLRNLHAECRDKACVCECGGLEARGAIDQADADRSLATALTEINATLAGHRTARLPEADVQGLVAELEQARARIREFEAGQPGMQVRRCGSMSARTGKPCQAVPEPGKDRCRAHRDKQ